ncbi:MAG: SLC13 family permease, partial [Candidatus Sumerlaeota bacterium]
MEIAVLILILFVVMTLYITRWIPIEVTSVLIPPALFFSGLLDVPTTLSGLSSSATVTIGAMYILSAGLRRTGVLEGVTLAMSKYSGDSVRRFFLVLAVTIPFTSAFMNNTPVVVMMVPVVMSISNKLDASPSKLLIP